MSNLQSDKAVKFFLNIGKLEGWSFLILLFIAMPLKYGFDFPDGVKHVGMAHGILFVMFALIILVILLQKKISFKTSVIAFLLSFIPFGTFYLKKLINNAK
jgi:integral membrane protein